MNQRHARNLQDDRRLGNLWERNFCLLASAHGYVFTPHQFKRDGSASAYCLLDGKWHVMTLPDITIWTAPGQHHEVKHKAPTKHGCFGLEQYRFEALLWFTETTGQRVFYTIHDHSLNGGRESNHNKLEHWVTVDVAALRTGFFRTFQGTSYVRGEPKTVPIHYWKTNLWQPLRQIWDVSNASEIVPALDEAFPFEQKSLSQGFLPGLAPVKKHW